MADYARIRTIIEVSEAADYSEPYIKETLSYTLTPDEAKWNKIEVATGTAQTYDLSHFSSISTLIVMNTDSTNFVTCRWYREVGTQANDGVNGFSFVNTTVDEVNDLNTGGTFATNGAAAGLYAWPSTPTKTATQKTYGINSVTGDQILCTPEFSVSALEAQNPDLTADLHFLDRARVQIAAGRVLVIDSCAPSVGLQLAADTAAVTLKILALGT